MIVSCIGSGSSANCFLVTNSRGEILILDAGVKMKHILSHRRFTSCHNVTGALITHEHKDHSLSYRDIFKSGIRIFSYQSVEPKKKYLAGSYILMPFECPHDGVKNYGFVIEDRAEKKRIVYATDTTALPAVDGVDAWLVECNYDQASWDRNVAVSDNLSYFGRVARSHMSLEYLVQYFKNAVKKRPDAVILCHLSENGNADKTAIVEGIKPFAPVVDIASKGKEWIL